MFMDSVCVCYLIDGTHPCYGSYVVGDGDQHGSGQVFFADAVSLLFAHHVTKTAIRTSFKPTQCVSCVDVVRRACDPQVTDARHSPGRHGAALQAEALVVSPVDVSHQLVHVGGVALAGHFQRLLERLAARQQTAQTQECPASETERGREGEDQRCGREVEEDGPGSGLNLD